jgi:formylglycine-generating enzyme required for sulfatase activity
MGSSGEDALAAYLQCQREPWAHRCEPTMFGDELPPRVITLSAYFIDRTEVTVAAYGRCVELGRCQAPPYESGAARFARADFPVSLVTWDDARRYCEFRGARLPTEAEFERAARGTRARTYPWGDLYNSHFANHGRLGWDRTSDTDGFAELAKVGSLPWGATPEGIADLAGNVAEWVSDRYQSPYDLADTADPRGPSDNRLPRVVRGGGYESGAAWLRGAARTPVAEDTRSPSIGFRCVRSERVTAPATRESPPGPATR